MREERATGTAIHWHLESTETTIRAVLFDFDGTLVDSEYLHHESWLEAVEPWGVTVSWEEYVRQLVGISDTRACKYFLGRAGKAVTPEAVEQGRRRKHRVYRSRSIEELKIDHRVRDWILRNHGAVPMGVVSSSAIPDVVPILQRQGVADCMEFIICGDHVKRLKPDPAPYLLALSKLRSAFGIEDSLECLVYEDSRTGIQAAAAAGTTVHALGATSDLPSAMEEWQERIKGIVDSRLSSRHAPTSLEGGAPVP